MLACRDLRKAYRTPGGSIQAVARIDLDVAPGRFVAVIGRSGSGKSSLMAMIGGLSRPDAGTVCIEGTDIWSLGDAALARFRNRCIGYVFQFANLLAALPALDNVALPGLLWRRRDANRVRERAARLLDSVGLGQHLDAYPAEMSAGEQRRAGIARALINAPRLLLADEPTSDLDEQSEREVMAELLRACREDGVTLVLVTHALALAAEADQVVQIADGTLVS
ncbi:MAG TPA: ABC transporter ATP-binding protein [Acetobacteraceae bacterium]|jgi:ABC-type lipoprotein export system ATPase subunit